MFYNIKYLEEEIYPTVQSTTLNTMNVMLIYGKRSSWNKVCRYIKYTKRCNIMYP